MNTKFTWNYDTGRKFYIQGLQLEAMQAKSNKTIGDETGSRVIGYSYGYCWVPNLRNYKLYTSFPSFDDMCFFQPDCPSYIFLMESVRAHVLLPFTEGTSDYCQWISIDKPGYQDTPSCLNVITHHRPAYYNTESTLKVKSVVLRFGLRCPRRLNVLFLREMHTDKLGRVHFLCKAKIIPFTIHLTSFSY